MGIGGVSVFDPVPGGGAPTVEELCANLAARLVQLPRYSQRLSSTRTGGFAWPRWTDDDRFRIPDHVTHVVLPAPGGLRRVVRVGGRLLFAPARPDSAAVGNGTDRGARLKVAGRSPTRPITASSMASAPSMSPTCCSTPSRTPLSVRSRRPHRWTMTRSCGRSCLARRRRSRTSRMPAPVSPARVSTRRCIPARRSSGRARWPSSSFATS